MIVIDYQDRRPLYEQVAGKLRILIIKGVLLPEEQLPSVRSLSMELSINPSTIQKAYALLEREGYIYPVKGRGNFVCPQLDTAKREREKMMEEIAEKLKKARDLGISKEDVLSLLEDTFGKENL
ncbi:MAG: GntR family transcriptional regulator [Blautia sp.]|nr:GntR family transcriptional regulator [Blautia sp.]